MHETLREWRVDDESCADAQLMVSELFTNAVRHTTSDSVACELWVIGVRLRLEVTDEGGGDHPALPRGCGAPDTEGENGRGLLLVSVLSDEWGVRPASPEADPDAGGHAVWAEMCCSRTAPAPPS